MVNFDELCDNYEEILDRDLGIFGEKHSYFAEFKARWIGAFLDKRPFNANPRVLDIGCGTGTLHDHINRYIPKAACYGIDISFRSLKKARLKNNNAGSFYCAYDGISIPFKDNSFDLAILANVLHHVPSDEDRRMIFKEANRALNPGGYLFIFEHNPYNPLVQRVVRGCVNDRDARLLKMRSAEKFLSRGNFQISRADYIVFFPHFLRMFRFLEKRLNRLFLGAQYVIVAKKI